MSKKRFCYTPEQIEFVREAYLVHNKNVIAELFAERFGILRTPAQIKTMVATHKIRANRRSGGRYSKGVCPSGLKATQFKRGYTPKNKMPVSTEQVRERASSKYIAVYVKTADPSTWRPKSVVVWEKANNRIVPKGHNIIFADGDRHNFDPNNLLLVTKEQMMVMCSAGLCFNNMNMTKCGAALAALKIAKNDAIKNKKGVKKAGATSEINRAEQVLQL